MNIGAITAATTSLTAIANKWHAELAMLDERILKAANEGKFWIRYDFCPRILDRYLKNYGYQITWDGASAIISW